MISYSIMVLDAFGMLLLLSRGGFAKGCHLNTVEWGYLYPLHLKMRFLTIHLASNLKRFSIEKLYNTTSIVKFFSIKTFQFLA
ncbi:MAG: hypothetical protein WBE18_00155, partial [Gammaproteobacteria bacterium]